MDVDIIVGLLKRKGFTGTKSKKYAGYILSTSKSLDIPISELIDNLSDYFTFVDLGISDNMEAHYTGVATGIMNKKPKKSLVDRNILL